ncbi:MAG: MerR family transcriptional regulator [Patescibacteria group bacterium]|nr:MerR family transcriptional regulator [Patescibacteria group bacterium]
MVINNQYNISIGKASSLIGVSIDTLRRWDKNGKFIAVRHKSSGNRYYSQEDIDLFLNDSVALARKWAFSSVPILPKSNFHCRTRDVFQARLETFQDKLTKSIGIEKSSLVTAVTGEIGNNSFDHNLGNWPDILGIFFAITLNREVVVADRGRGILVTLGRIDSTLKTDTQALAVAFTKIISGRSPEVRGNGLKFVKNIVTSNPIKLSFQTGNALLELSEKKDKVKVKVVDKTVRGCFAIIKY